jgi:hypothetical protein
MFPRDVGKDTQFRQGGNPNACFTAVEARHRGQFRAFFVPLLRNHQHEVTT